MSLAPESEGGGTRTMRADSTEPVVEAVSEAPHKGLATTGLASAERRFGDVAQSLYRQVEGSRFLLWRGHRGPDGRLTKKPQGSTAQLADWLPFEALKAEVLSPDGGVGLVLTGGIKHEGYHLVVVDLDAAVEPATRAVQPWAMEIIQVLGNSFTTVSVSGTGLHAYVLVQKPPLSNTKFDLPQELAAPGVAKAPNVQLFALRGFVTVSCDQLSGTGDGELGRLVRHNDLEFLYSKFGKQPPTELDPGDQPAGEGPVPTAGQIRAQVEKVPRAKLLLEKKLDEWLDPKADEEKRDRSTSAQFFVLAQHVLIAANGHLDAAVDFLFRETPWGVHTGSDQLGRQKYDRKWIEEDLVRAWQKGDVVANWRRRRDPARVFEPITDVDSAMASNATAGASGEATSSPTGTPFVDFRARFRQVREGQNDGVLVHGLLSRGRITNVAAAPKAGKSTWIMAALAGFAANVPRGLEGFGAPAHPLRTLYLSENHPDDDAVTFCAFDPPELNDGGRGQGCLMGVDQAAIPPAARPTWAAFLEWVSRQVRDGRFDVVVFDTLEKWIPDLEDSNAAAQIAARFNELSRILAQGCGVAVVCVLHVKKQNGPTLDFDAMLGSTKFRGSSDINLILVRHRPDDLRDTRIVVRREMRDPWGLVKNACGRLPESVSATIRERGHGGPARLCYRVVGMILTDTKGQEYAHLSYELEDVPPEWVTATSSVRKVSPGAKNQMDEHLLLHAAQLHAKDTGNKPVSPRRLLAKGYITRAVEQGGELPSGYETPGESRVRSAGKRLTAAGKLISHGKKGMTVAPPLGFQSFEGAQGVG